MTLHDSLHSALAPDLLEALNITQALGETTIEVPAARYLELALALRDHPALRFETLIDLCGMDYSEYGGTGREGVRFAAVSHLLSLTHNPGFAFVRVARMTTFRCWPRCSRSGLQWAGSSVKPSISTASSLKVTPTCVAS